MVYMWMVVWADYQRGKTVRTEVSGRDLDEPGKVKAEFLRRARPFHDVDSMDIIEIVRLGTMLSIAR